MSLRHVPMPNHHPNLTTAVWPLPTQQHQPLLRLYCCGLLPWVCSPRTASTTLLHTTGGIALCVRMMSCSWNFLNWVIEPHLGSKAFSCLKQGEDVMHCKQGKTESGHYRPTDLFGQLGKATTAVADMFHDALLLQQLQRRRDCRTLLLVFDRVGFGISASECCSNPSSATSGVSNTSSSAPLVALAMWLPRVHRCCVMMCAYAEEEVSHAGGTQNCDR